MELIDVVRKLVGPIEPVGDSRIDHDRFENLQTMTKLVDKLLGDIDRIIPCKDSHEASVKKAGMHADAFFEQVGIKE